MSGSRKKCLRRGTEPRTEKRRRPQRLRFVAGSRPLGGRSMINHDCCFLEACFAVDRRHFLASHTLQVDERPIGSSFQRDPACKKLAKAQKVVEDNSHY